MFRKVVSNFRRKANGSGKSMKNSISSCEIETEHDFTRKFSTKFNSDDSLNSMLSVFDNDTAELRHSECVRVVNESNSQGICLSVESINFSSYQFAP